MIISKRGDSLLVFLAPALPTAVRDQPCARCVDAQLYGAAAHIRWLAA